ncbi:MAG: NifU family protein [Erysipelotrichaceae bacterium]|nr:NifU family protein [Erysipelotrichaceae bacterium]
METNDKIKAVKKTINKLRPFLQADGGDVEFVRLEDDIVYVNVVGACVGCASLSFTLKDGIESLIMDEVEGIKEVRLADDSLNQML